MHVAREKEVGDIQKATTQCSKLILIQLCSAAGAPSPPPPINIRRLLTRGQ